VRIVVTGANGQLGKACHQVFSSLSNLYSDVIYLDRISFNLSRSGNQIRQQIEDLRPDLFINAAAYTDVVRAENDLSTAYQVNGTAVGAIADACNKLGTFLFHISTDYVFAVEGMNDHKEDEIPRPTCVYGKSKYVGETYLSNVERSMIVRTSWLYGDGDNFVSTIVNRAMVRKVASLSVGSDKLGRPTLAWNLAFVLAQLITLSQEGTLPLFCICKTKVNRYLPQLLHEILKKYRKTYIVKDVMTEEYYKLMNLPVVTSPKHSVFDLSLMNSLGLTSRDWKESLQEYLRDK
jgi:dTDP-4-dehydrorhamnose reductase